MICSALAHLSHAAGYRGGRVALLALLCITTTHAQPADLSDIAHQVVADVCERRVVLLGELPSHGEAQAFETKAEIVRGLVEQCGFDGILFEAGIYDFLGVEDAIAADRATFRSLNRAIGRFWWTAELADWRRWLFDRATSGALMLGGIDDQPSVTSDFARAALPDLVGDAVPTDQANTCRAAIDRNLHWRYDEQRPFDEAEQDLLGRCARQATDASASPGDTLPTHQQTMISNIAGYYARQFGSGPDRDAAMHRNIRWYLARQPDSSKVIVWTATVHATRQPAGRPAIPLGTRLAETWGDDLAAIGFTAYTGTSSMAGMPPQPLSDAPPGSLEATATADGSPSVYLSASALQRVGAVASRLFGRFASHDWSEYFDGVVVIREEHPPTFEAWQ